MNLQEALSRLPETDKNVVSVLSGGLDSTVMTHLLVAKYGPDRVFALSFDYGQKQIIELKKAAATCMFIKVAHKVLDLGILGDIASKISANISGTDVAMPTIKDVLGDPQPVTYVPFRNMILNSLAFSFAEANDAAHVFTGLQVHDEYGYWDTSKAFVDNMNAVANLNRTAKIKIEAPFSDLSKLQEINIMKEMSGVDYLSNTITCYDPDEHGASCGKCPSCSERIMNFAKAGEIDPIEYVKGFDINWRELINKYEVK